MTEIDRIIEKGSISEDFLKPETICDFYVDESRKKIWAIELDILLEFDKICKKHNLHWFLMFGSLLGAIRHEGFIPWDDDTDVCMPRDDYDKFLALKEEIKHPYFLQTPSTDDGYYFTYAKIRNSNTTGLTTNFMYQRINWGMMLDIFPLDNVVLEGSRERYDKVAKFATDNSNAMRILNPHPSENDLLRIKAYSGRDPIENLKDIDKIATQFNDRKTDYVSIASLTLYSYERSFFYAEDFSSYVLRSFMGHEFPVPVGYDRVLNTIYPDYMQLPPPEQRLGWHGNVIFDAEKPYTEYLPY